jgi:hypothetical protein
VDEPGIGRVDLDDAFIIQQTETLLRSFALTFGRPMLPDLPESLSELERAR